MKTLAAYVVFACVAASSSAFAHGSHMSSGNLNGHEWSQLTNHNAQMTMKNDVSIDDHGGRHFERIRRLRFLERELAALAAFDAIPVATQDQIEVIELRKEIEKLKRELALAASL